MQVPTYERQVTHRAVRPNPEAFGVGVAQAGQQAAQVTSGIGQLMQKRAIEIQQEKDTQQVLEAETQMRKEINDLLHSQEMDENGRPVGILQRTLANADGATKDFDEKIEQVRQKYSGMFGKSENQTNQFNQLYKNAYDSTLNMVVRHEAAQGRESRKQTVNDNLNQLISDAAANPDAIIDIIANGKAKVHVSGSFEGETPESIKYQQQIYAGAATMKAVDVLLQNGDHRKAQEVFDKVKKELPGDVKEKIQTAIQEEAFIDELNGVYSELQTEIKPLADGSPDFAKIEEQVKKKYTSEKGEKAWNYIKGKFGEDERMRLQRQEAKDRSFTNEVIAFKNGGGGYTAALKYAKKYGYDTTDTYAKEEYIRRLYGVSGGPGGSNQSQPSSYIQLWEGIRTGAVNRQHIDEAFNNGLLSQSDWESLRKDWFNDKLTGIKEEDQQIAAYINLKANELYGKREEDKNTFKYLMLQKTKGKGIEEATAIIDRGITKTGGSWFFNVGAKESWKREFKQQDADNLKWGQYYTSLGGRDVVYNIGASLAYVQGKKSFNEIDIDNFIKHIGGEEALKPDSLQMKAIRLLIKQGEFVTPTNVNDVIKYYGNDIPF